MIVGILKEIKTLENRVCMTPAGVEIMREHGHTVLVENSAGIGTFDNICFSCSGLSVEATTIRYFVSLIGSIDASIMTFFTLGNICNFF